MESSKMKNMVVLKNLPSNLVEEAIVILKSNKKVRKLQKIEKRRKVEKEENIKKERDYVLKEAEMLVASYISELEDKQEQKKYKKIEKNKKYTRLRNYAYLSSFIVVIETILLIVK